MVLAKNKDMAAYLGNMFKERSLYKAYYALVCGIPKTEKGIIRHSSEYKEDLWEIEAFDERRTMLKSHNYQDLIKSGG